MEILEKILAKNRITSHTEKEVAKSLENINKSINKLGKLYKDIAKEQKLLGNVLNGLYGKYRSLIKLFQNYEEQKNG